MDAPAVLAALDVAGLSARVDGGRLLLSPRDRITDDLRKAVAACRADLMVLVRRRAEEDEAVLTWARYAKGPVVWVVDWP